MNEQLINISVLNRQVLNIFKCMLITTYNHAIGKKKYGHL